jgi:hypothetical protein
MQATSSGGKLAMEPMAIRKVELEPFVRSAVGSIQVDLLMETMATQIFHCTRPESPRIKRVVC